MRFSIVSSALLVALVAAEQQPLGWFDQIKAFLPSTPSPAAKAASLLVHQVTYDNWRDLLLAESDRDVEEWMVMFTGNTTCFDRCEAAERAFNASSIILKGRRAGPKLGEVNCDVEKLLCATWSAGLPEIWHFLIAKPAKDQSRATSPLHIIPLEPKNVTAAQIVKIHTDKAYLEQPEYTGAFHPLDGWLEKYMLLQPLGYVFYAFGSTPSWLVMIGISFLSRRMMARRTPGVAAPAPATAPAGAQPAGR